MSLKHQGKWFSHGVMPFNNDDYSSLEQLIHPLRKGRFAQDRHMVKDRLKTWLVHSYEMGQPVKINQKLPGMKARLKYKTVEKLYEGCAACRSRRPMVDLAILNINLTIILGLYAALVGFALGPDLLPKTE